MKADADFLLDSNILIEHLRQQTGESILQRALARYGGGAISVVSNIEYAAGELHASRKPNFEMDFPGILVFPHAEGILRRAPYIQAHNIGLNRRMDRQTY